MILLNSFHIALYITKEQNIAIFPISSSPNPKSLLLSLMIHIFDLNSFQIKYQIPSEDFMVCQLINSFFELKVPHNLFILAQRKVGQWNDITASK